MEEAALSIRQRRETDHAVCLRLLELVHERDGYPLVWPRDPIGWLEATDALGAWVGEYGGSVVGQVVLRPASGPPLRVWEAGTGLAAERLAVISRLFVDPRHRRWGVGRALLAAAVDEARRLSLQPVLDVLAGGHEATRLYEQQGWTRVGFFVWDMPDGSREPAYAYALI